MGEPRPIRNEAERELVRTTTIFFSQLGILPEAAGQIILGMSDTEAEAYVGIFGITDVAVLRRVGEILESGKWFVK